MKSENSHHPDSIITAHRSPSEVQEWLVRQLAEELRTNPETISVDRPLLATGIDSVHVVSLMAKLEDWGGFRFSENPLEDHSTIEQLSQFVANLTRSSP